MDTLSTTETVPKKNAKSPGARIGAAVASIFGILIGFYCGIHLLIPLAFAFAFAWLLTKFSAGPAVFRGALAVQTAHALWMAAGGLIAGVWSQVAVDILIIVAGLVWLWVRPGLGPVILLGLYQAGASVVNAVALAYSQTGSVANKALVAHLCFRLAASAFLIAGYAAIRKNRVTPVPTPAPAAIPAA